MLVLTTEDVEVLNEMIQDFRHKDAVKLSQFLNSRLERAAAKEKAAAPPPEKQP